MRRPLTRISWRKHWSETVVDLFFVEGVGAGAPSKFIPCDQSVSDGVRFLHFPNPPVAFQVLGAYVKKGLSMAVPPQCGPKAPPSRVYIFELKDLLAWYEANLCAKLFVDPRKD